jgi:membrane-associated phospholipid phosphatase
MIPKIAAGGLIAALSCAPAYAAGDGNPNITSAGTSIAIALPLIAGGIALSKDDWHGVDQLGAETVLTVGTAFALKQLVREKRPDGSDYQSFPSDTTALAASGSTFLWARYGWQYGLPAFVATQFVSYSRVQAKEHHWYDTLASSAIAIGYSHFVTTRFHQRYNIETSLSASPDGAQLQMSYKF